MENPIDIARFKEAIHKEKVVHLDFHYLQPVVATWWALVTDSTPLYFAKFQLIYLLLKHCKKEDLYYFDKLGTNDISAICINHIFTEDCPRLAMVVHEALSALFALNDIKYPYEEHKKLYLKAEGVHYRDWGNGYGEITPHSDDLYEDIDVDYLALTVCRDNTSTPTTFYFPKDILKNFTDEELSRLLRMRATFLSGKNVRTLKRRERQVIEFDEAHGFKFYLDFRIDNDIGPRMLPVEKRDHDLINKMRKNIKDCPRGEALPQTGSFLIVANFKILHARAQMNLQRELAEKISASTDYTVAPRLLYRSKGPDAKIISL